MPKRRKVILGLGALAFGSGAVSMNAAFSESVTSQSADMRVIAEADLRVRAGSGVPSDNSSAIIEPSWDSPAILNLTDNTDDRITSESLDWNDLKYNDIPVAGVDNSENDVLDLEVAVPIRPNKSSDLVFENLLEIANEGDTTEQEIAIVYDRGSGQYGSDVTTSSVGNNDIGPGTVQDIFQFRDENGDIISSNNGPGDGGSHSTTFDAPSDWFSLSPGQTMQLDLMVNTWDNSYNVVSRLRSNVPGTGNPFTRDAGSIDLLDEITVGTGASNY